MSELVSKQAAIDAICEALGYAYCDNCANQGDEDACEDCHRKYMKWSVSRECVERIINALPYVDTDLSEYSDKLWRIAYERGKAEAIIRNRGKEKKSNG